MINMMSFFICIMLIYEFILMILIVVTFLFVSSYKKSYLGYAYKISKIHF